MNKKTIEFLQREYFSYPFNDGFINLSETEIERMMLHIIEESVDFFVQRSIDRLEPYIDIGTLSTELSAAASETIDYYHGEY